MPSLDLSLVFQLNDESLVAWFLQDDIFILHGTEPTKSLSQ